MQVLNISRKLQHVQRFLPCMSQCVLISNSNLLRRDILCHSLFCTSSANLQEKRKLQPLLELLDDKAEQKLIPLRDKVKQQGIKVKELKINGAPDTQLKTEIAKLKECKKSLEDLQLELCPPEDFNRDRMMNLVLKRSYFSLAYEDYGGRAGLYKFGPLGAGLLHNILEEFHRHFVLHDAMLQEINPVITPAAVLKASGHVDKFADYYVKDSTTGQRYRLDHLIKQHLEQVVGDNKTSEERRAALRLMLTRVDGMSLEELTKVLSDLDVRAPETGNTVTEPAMMNLMFPLTIDGELCYLRPETGQGSFLNFHKLLAEADNTLPFAVAQVGPAFRNELNPHPRLLRLRQFTMAEIEHFCHPGDKTHQGFPTVSSEVLMLLSADGQRRGEKMRATTVAEAVKQGLVANETLGYYMARIQQYLLKIGIDRKKLRFRQHMANEMAHYACDCWDAECLTSYGWIECVGCADRSSYDLTCFANATGVDYTYESHLPEPKEVEVFVPVIDEQALLEGLKNNNVSMNKQPASKNLQSALKNEKSSSTTIESAPNNTQILSSASLKSALKEVKEILLSLKSHQVELLDKKLDSEDGSFKVPGIDYKVTRKMIPSVEKVVRTVRTEQVVPCVVEPSFGIERVLYAILEHTFRERDDKYQRAYFALPPLVAPIKVVVMALSSSHQHLTDPFLQDIASRLRAVDVFVRVDRSTGSIGRRYTRNDERSVAFAVTVDFDTIANSAAVDAATAGGAGTSGATVGDAGATDAGTAEEELHRGNATVTLRDRDSTTQVRIQIKEVASVVQLLSTGKMSWEDVIKTRPKFDQQKNTV